MAKRKPKKYRKFGKERFTLYGSQPTKSMAKTLAGNLRAQGLKARVLPAFKHWLIYFKHKR